MIQLSLKKSPTVAIEAEVLTPDLLCTLARDEICALKVYHGKRQCPLDEFFEIAGERSDTLQLRGDLNKVRWIGRAMTRGSIKIQGNVGMHLGAHMRGGVIEVSGDAGDWVGAEMKGGVIRVCGNSGGQVGAAYRGSSFGMRDGLIVIGGDAGLEVGMRMRRGTIVVGGLARDFAGLQMKGGTIVLLAGAEIRTGAWMNRGTIISLKPLQMMPTFRRCGDYVPTFIRVYARQLQQYGVVLPQDSSEGRYVRYTGDVAAAGQGEILLWNPIASRTDG